MEQYRKFITNLSNNNLNEVFLNTDKEHALEVLVQIFNQSQKIVRIYASSLCDAVGIEPEYIEALSSFIERGGEVRLLLNDPGKIEITKSSLFRRLAYYISDGKKVEIKSTSVKTHLSGDSEKKQIHFTVGDDKSFRVETDIEERSAVCNFNDPEFASKVIDLFDKMFNSSEAQSIDLDGLLNHK